MKYSCILCLCIFIIASCNNSGTATSDKDSTNTKSNTMLPDKGNFSDTLDGKITGLYILKNTNGMTAAITNYGGRVVSLMVPDKDGKFRDVSVGFGKVRDYTNPTDMYFGALIGRYGNRIGGAKFTLDGKEYKLAANNGPNSLHGGPKGFHAVVWEAKQLNDSTLELSYASKDGEEGFPGNLNVKVTCSITGNNELVFAYEATTDKKTVVNLTNHTYFNLNGEGSGTINNHILQIFANQYTPVDSTLIPTGKLEAVEGTPFDFRQPQTIGSRIEADNEQLKFGKGYDHNFVLTGSKIDSFNNAATVIGDKSGIVMHVYTEEPGIQFYGGNFMNDQNTFKTGAKDGFRTAFCLETQHYPDSPNQPSFPSTVLEPGQTYRTKTMYKFAVQSQIN